jgi:hypothetical protein
LASHASLNPNVAQKIQTVATTLTMRETMMQVPMRETMMQVPMREIMMQVPMREIMMQVPMQGNNDAGTDAGNNDAGTDAGNNDAGTDAGNDDGGSDAGIDGGNDAGPVNDGIDAVRGVSNGTIDIDVGPVLVTVVKPAVGTEVAGFFIQSNTTGPAIFVAVDPATLNLTGPSWVTFKATGKDTANSITSITSLSNFAKDVINSPADPQLIKQDVSAAADLVSAVQNYESEFVRITGLVTENASGAGSGHVSVNIDTAAVTGAGRDLRVRVPTDIGTTLKLDSSLGCSISLDAIVWRFNNSVQPSAWSTNGITVDNCPSVGIVSAVATSATQVVVTLGRNVDAASLTNATTQWTLNNGASVSAATADGNVVTLTTSSLVANQNYTLTIASSVLDVRGLAFTPNTIQFMGPGATAVLSINEFNANISNGCDQIELRVLEGGSLTNYSFSTSRGNFSDIVFPAMNVNTNELIVIHTNADNSTCVDGTTSLNTLSVENSLNAFNYSTSYANAYDIYVIGDGLTATNQVLSLSYNAVVVDAVAAINTDICTGVSINAGTLNDANTASAANQWVKSDGNGPTGGAWTAEEFCGNAVFDLDGTGTDAVGNSLQRSSNTDNQNKTSWTSAAASFGAPNAGQSSL